MSGDALDEPLYDVFLTGHVVTGRKKDAVAPQVARLLKVPEKYVILRLLRGEPTQVKSGIDASTARLYREVFREAGAETFIEMVPCDEADNEIFAPDPEPLTAPDKKVDEVVEPLEEEGLEDEELPLAQEAAAQTQLVSLPERFKPMIATLSQHRRWLAVSVATTILLLVGWISTR